MMYRLYQLRSIGISIAKYLLPKVVIPLVILYLIMRLIVPQSIQNENPGSIFGFTVTAYFFCRIMLWAINRDIEKDGKMSTTTLESDLKWYKNAAKVEANRKDRGRDPLHSSEKRYDSYTQRAREIEEELNRRKNA